MSLPVGVYSAGLRRRDKREAVIIAGMSANVRGQGMADEFVPAMMDRQRAESLKSAVEWPARWILRGAMPPRQETANECLVLLKAMPLLGVPEKYLSWRQFDVQPI